MTEFYTRLWPRYRAARVGKLGRNQYREGTWDRLEEQGKQRCHITEIVAGCVARYAATLVMRHFFLSSLEPSPSKRSQAPLRY